MKIGMLLQDSSESDSKQSNTNNKQGLDMWAIIIVALVMIEGLTLLSHHLEILKLNSMIEELKLSSFKAQKSTRQEKDLALEITKGPQQDSCTCTTEINQLNNSIANLTSQVNNLSTSQGLNFMKLNVETEALSSNISSIMTIMDNLSSNFVNFQRSMNQFGTQILLDTYLPVCYIQNQNIYNVLTLSLESNILETFNLFTYTDMANPCNTETLNLGNMLNTINGKALCEFQFYLNSTEENSDNNTIEFQIYQQESLGYACGKFNYCYWTYLDIFNFTNATEISVSFSSQICEPLNVTIFGFCQVLS